jgi:phosphate transport system substrate-binding protein
VRLDLEKQFISKEMKMNKIFGRVCLFVTSVSFIAVSCDATVIKELSTPTSGTETIICDETFKPIIEDEKNVFESLYQNATIQAQYKNENDAIDCLLKDSTHLAIVTRRLSNEEKGYFESKQLFPKEVLIAYDAIAIIVHPSNNDTMLTLNQLKDVFTGKISRWDQLNDKRNHAEIKVIFDNPKSSTVSYITKNICNNMPITNAVSALTNQEVIDKVSREENSIGIIGANWISDRDDTTCMNFMKRIKVVALTSENTANYSNCFKPYQAYIATGDYPIRRELLCLLTEPRSGLCSGFVTFLASERGQRIILKSGLLPATQTIRIVHVNSNQN